MNMNGMEPFRKSLKIWEVIPTLGGGGAEKMVLDLTQGLQGKNHNVTIISLYGEEWAAANRIEYAKDNCLQIRYLNKKRGFDIGIVRKLAKMIKKEKPDIIHSHLSAFQYVAYLGYYTRLTHVHTVHSIIQKEPLVYRWLLKNASKRKRTHFVVLSEEIGRQMEKVYGTASDKMSCIPNGIDREFFHPAARTFNSKTTVFITVGSMIPVKNHKLLIDAFSMIEKKRNYADKLIILGDGDLREKTEKQIRDLQLDNNVFLPGNVSNVRDYLYGADVFVMTSHYEGVSLALLEAASTGLPVIATHTGNTPNVVGEDAVLVDDNDVQELAREMIRFAQNEEYRKEFVEKSGRLSSRFDKTKMIQSYCEIYSTLTK